MVWTREQKPHDALSVPMKLTDRVTVIAAGEGATKTDIGRIGRIVSFSRTRAKVRFPDAQATKSIGLSRLAVRRRDGADDHEGNRSHNDLADSPR